MSVLRFATLLVATTTLASTSLAQAPRIVKGTRADLKGMTKVFVDTQKDGYLRDLVASQLRHQLPELTIVDRRGNDTLVVQFSRQVGHRSTKADTRASEMTVEPMNRDRLPASGNPRGGAAQPQRATSGTAVRRPGASAQPTSTMSVEPDASRTDAILFTPSAFGRVLKVGDAGSFNNVLDFRSTLWRPGNLELAAKDFVGKLAKEYRKANATK
jgi:hypothetical protein